MAQLKPPPSPQLGGGAADFYLFTQARGALVSDPEIKDADIVVAVKNGAVTLTGIVRSDETKTKAEQLVRGVGGVKSVSNRLKVSGGASR